MARRKKRRSSLSLKSFECVAMLCEPFCRGTTHCQFLSGALPSAMLVTQLSIEVADRVGAPRGIAVANFR
jgi:hypothetical protein